MILKRKRKIIPYGLDPSWKGSLLSKATWVGSSNRLMRWSNSAWDLTKISTITQQFSKFLNTLLNWFFFRKIFSLSNFQGFSLLKYWQKTLF